MEFLKKIFLKNEWVREFVYIFKPFFDDCINPSSTLFHIVMLIPFLRIWIVRIKIGKVGKNLKFKHPIYIQNGRNITVGDNVTFGQGLTIVAGKKSTVKIGDNVACAPWVFICSSSHGAKKGRLIKYQELIEKNTVIGNDVWLGINSVVLHNTILADGTVLGANSVAGPNFNNGSDEILLGVPAKIKRRRK
tara:strand:+ start:1240 stop:1812 length:573 start_codon:yes stop_codon:yes gene_type:complete